MSIAVSAVVKPSRFLLALVMSMCLLVASIGIGIAIGAIGELSTGGRLVLGMTCILFAFSGVPRAVSAGKTHRIDITGNGDIRLMETSAVDASVKEAETAVPGLVQLSPDSTLWPFLLVLRLRHEKGTVSNLVVLPDSVDPDAFIALKVACHWIANRKRTAEDVNFSDF